MNGGTSWLSKSLTKIPIIASLSCITLEELFLKMEEPQAVLSPLGAHHVLLVIPSSPSRGEFFFFFSNPSLLNRSESRLIVEFYGTVHRISHSLWLASRADNLIQKHWSCLCVLWRFTHAGHYRSAFI